MERVQHAVARFEKGFNCAQAVLSSFSAPYGLERETALKLGSAFGAGLSRRGDTCGAVTGAMMVIGLEYGRTRAEDIQAREDTYAKTQEFFRQFETKCGSIVCRELLGYDVSKLEDLAHIRATGLSKELCPGFVRSASEILHQMLK